MINELALLGKEQVVTGMSQRREDSNGVGTSLEGRRETLVLRNPSRLLSDRV